MARLWDICSLLLTSALFVGVILSIMLVIRKSREAKDAFKASLDRRGWTVASVPRDGADGGSANGGGGKVVMLKSKKKRMMDHERYLDATQRGVMRAVQASTFGAPPSSLVVEDPRVGAAAGSGSSPRTLHRLLPHRSERSEAGGAGGAGGASDSGSDTAASVDASVVGTGASWSQELHDHPHVQQVRRWGHSLKGHMESLLAD